MQQLNPAIIRASKIATADNMYTAFRYSDPLFNTKRSFEGYGYNFMNFLPYEVHSKGIHYPHW